MTFGIVAASHRIKVGPDIKGKVHTIIFVLTLIKPKTVRIYTLKNSLVLIYTLFLIYIVPKMHFLTKPVLNLRICK